MTKFKYFFLLIILFLTACDAAPEVTSVPPLPTVVLPTPITPIVDVTQTVPFCTIGNEIPFVYHPSRLIVIQSCIRVFGNVVAMRNEDDGDIHMIVKLSASDSAHYLNGGNSYQGGNLVVEPICVNKPTQADAIALCAQDLHPFRDLPLVGDCVLLQGQLVEDTVHYNWREIHPLGAWQKSTNCSQLYP